MYIRLEHTEAEQTSDLSRKQEYDLLCFILCQTQLDHSSDYIHIQVRFWTIARLRTCPDLFSDLTKLTVDVGTEERRAKTEDTKTGKNLY